MSEPQFILEAIKLTSSGDFASLSRLLNATPLEPTLIFRILLTYLVEGVEPESYIPIIQQIISPSSTPQIHRPEHSTGGSSKTESNDSVRNLRLVPLAFPGLYIDENAETLTLFLIHQAHKIDQETGSLDLVRRLIEPFVHHSEALQIWAISILLPLLRLEYEYHAYEQQTHTLDSFERLSEAETFAVLLPRDFTGSSQHPKIDGARDIKGLVGPWMHGDSSRKRRKLSQRESGTQFQGTRDKFEDDGGFSPGGWAYVNDWILDLSRHDYERAVGTIGDWDGPADVDFGEWRDESLPTDQDEESGHLDGYLRTLLATFVTNPTLSDGALESSLGLLRKVCILKGLAFPTSSTTLGEHLTKTLLDGITPAHLLRANLLHPDNPLTDPSPSSIAFLHIILVSASRLEKFGLRRTCQNVTESILFHSVEDQKLELQRVFQRLKGQRISDSGWHAIRNDLLWLRDWTYEDSNTTTTRSGVFCQIPPEELELEILRATLDAGCYRLPIDLYFKKDAPLTEGVVKDTILSAAFAYYDAATNGNKTRGQMKNAADLIQFFKGQFSSRRFLQIEALLAATHSMSFYSLTLQPGHSFLPVNIRAHRDPMSLIGKILHQNPRSYTHLDDLIDIGQNLVSAGLEDIDHGTQGSFAAVDGDLEAKSSVARRKVTRMAIEAALAEDDFDTAYSYVVNRLHMEAKIENKDQVAGHYDDISWRAAYAAGRYPTSHDGTSALRRIEQRMELLSQALLLAPPPALSELLTVWQTCEENLNELLAQDIAQDDEVDQLHDHYIPGGFAGTSTPPPQKSRAQTKNALQEEAPMGLFDAAREVGAALGKSAFPLRGLQRGSARGAESQARERELYDADSADGNRVRKRDMVSNMVTGGLASGIGWVIGESI